MRPTAATYRFMNGPLRAPPCGTLTIGARLPALRPRRRARKRPRGPARDVREQVRGGGRDETGLSDVQVHERPAELASAPSDTQLRRRSHRSPSSDALGAMRRASALGDESAGRFERPRVAHMRDRARRDCLGVARTSSSTRPGPPIARCSGLVAEPPHGPPVACLLAAGPACRSAVAAG
jgi:hypothetical protein